MNVLIVEHDRMLGGIWRDHLMRLGATCDLVVSQHDAVETLGEKGYDVVILNLNLECGSALAVADYASFRHPDMKVIFVTSSSFFSDGSIFGYMANACALVSRASPPDDLAALADYHGGTAP